VVDPLCLGRPGHAIEGRTREHQDALLLDHDVIVLLILQEVLLPEKCLSHLLREHLLLVMGATVFLLLVRFLLLESRL
jgi:hypothetical protein